MSLLRVAFDLGLDWTPSGAGVVLVCVVSSISLVCVVLCQGIPAGAEEPSGRLLGLVGNSSAVGLGGLELAGLVEEVVRLLVCTVAWLSLVGFVPRRVRWDFFRGEGRGVGSRGSSTRSYRVLS